MFSLNYEKNIEIIAKLIEKDCKPALREMRQAGNFPWRGLYGTTSIFVKKKTRKDRRPKDAPKFIHDMINDILGKKFGWFPRSEGVICSNDYMVAEEYGPARAIFPIGRYKCVWTAGLQDLLDIYPWWFEDIERRPKDAISAYMRGSQHRRTYGDIDVISLPLDKQIEQLKKIARKIMEAALSRVKQTGLKEPLSYRDPSEMMIGCKEYYSVSGDIMNKVSDALRVEYRGLNETN